MKTLIVCLSFVKKNLIPILIITIMLTATLFTLISFYGNYRYMSYARDVMLRSPYKNSTYFMLNAEGNPDLDKALSDNVRETVKKYLAYSSLIEYKKFHYDENNTVYNVMIYDETMRSFFQLEVKKGRWLSANPDHTEVVIGGKTWGDAKIGDIITINGNISAEVVGIMNEKVVYPSFSLSSNNYHSADFVFKVNDTIAFLTEETLSEEEWNNISQYTKDLNFWVVMDETSSVQERENLNNYLASCGMIAEYDDIIEASDIQIRTWLSNAFPLPVFLIIVSTLCVICICTVIVKRSMSENSKYYLLGATKRRGVMILTLPLAFFFSAPCLLNIASAVWFPDFLRAGKRTAAIDYLIGLDAAVPVILYCALLMAVVTLVPTIIYRRYSPIELYRRNL